MGLLKIEPTITSEWYNLVKDAEDKSTIHLNEDLESYLVFLLLRFTKEQPLATNIFAVEFLKSLQSFDKNQESLRETGDKCLLFSGLFPKNTEHRRIRLSYYVNLGRQAYSILAHQPKEQLADLFAELSENFVTMMDVLLTIRELGNEEVLSPLLAHELWSDTQSLEALKILNLYSKKNN